VDRVGVESGSSPEELIIEREYADCVHAGLREVREPYAEAVQLHYLGGLTQQEVAAHQGIAAATARTRIWRGLKQLKAALRKRGIQAVSLVVVSGFRQLSAEAGLAFPVKPITTLIPKGMFIMTICSLVGLSATIILATSIFPTQVSSAELDGSPSVAENVSQVVERDQELESTPATVDSQGTHTQLALPQESDRWYAFNNSRAGSKFAGAGYYHIQVVAHPDNPGLMIQRARAVMVASSQVFRLEYDSTIDRSTNVPTHIAVRLTPEADDSEAEVVAFTIDVDQDKASSQAQLSLNFNGEIRNKNIGVPFLTALPGSFEIVRQLPFIPGFVYSFDSLEAEEFHVKKDHTIAYLGKQSISINEADRALHVYEQSGKGIQNLTYYLDDDHELVRVLMDGSKEFLLTTKDLALQNLPQRAN
jgi:hypothetical protein